jgi:hypothetical protein
MWFIGVMIACAALTGMVMERSVTVRQAGRLALVPALSVVAAALTPIGPSLLLAPLHVGGYAKYVTEWLPPSLKDYNMAVTMAMVVLCVVSWSRSGSKVPWPRVAILVVALGWTLLYARTIAVGAMMLAPLLALSLQSHLPRRRVSVKTEASCIGTSSVLVVVLALLLAPHVATKPGRVPASFAPRLAALAPGTIVYNDYELGGWLLLSHRQLSPVIDPRTEVFSLEYVDRYMSSLRAAPGWRETVGASQATVAILPMASPLAGELLHEGWSTKQQERGFGYLVAP